jgi:membrane fusion protein, heavy metal efflux system
MYKFIRYLSLLALLCGWFGIGTVYAESDHDEAGQEHGAEEEEHDEGGIEMDTNQRLKFGVLTEKIERRLLADEVLAPGEVVINTYQSSQVTPRISAQIVSRHARLGDPVKKEQPLVTLSSVEMAEAQGNLLVTSREWQRVKKLGREVVSERRYVEAQVAYQQAQAKVRAFGMTSGQINILAKQNDVSKATGSFKLLAPQDGTVTADDFVIGEVIEPGRILFEITDESTIWVEARLNPEDASGVTLGTKVRISRDGKQWLDGEVIQLHHRLDERTRTQSVRIQISNANEDMHPGQFVEVTLQIGDGTMKLAVPQKAIVLMDGNPAIFMLNGDDIRPQQIEIGETYGEWTEVKVGLATGDEIVVQGAFLIKSLLLKSQMGEGHGH